MQLTPFLTQALCPAGAGIYTVTTGRDRTALLQQTLYGSCDLQQAWLQQLQQIDGSQPCLLGIPSDVGGGVLRGANWGPWAIRQRLYQALSPQLVHDLGDVRVIPQLLLDEYVSTELLARCRQAMYGQSNTWPVSPLSIASQSVSWLYQHLPQLRLLGMGGDHSVSYPLVCAYLQQKKKQGRQVGVLHFDAHTDLLQERLGIPINFASWVSHTLPEMVHPSCWIQIGIRATGHPAEYWQQHFGIQQHWADACRTRGAEQVVQDIIEQVRPYHLDEWYVTFDIDAIDAQYVTATGTPEPHGLLPADAHTLLRGLAQHAPITGADLVEVAPFTGERGDSDETLSVAHDLMMILIQALRAT